MLRALTCLLAALLLAGCDSRTQPDARERALLLTAADFGEPEAPGQARLRRETNYLTRRVDISYDYRQTPGFFLHSGVSLMPNATDAVVSSFAAIQGAGIGISNADGDVTQETLALSRELGSHAELILLRSAGEPVGNMFAVSIGEKMFFTVFSGRTTSLRPRPSRTSSRPSWRCSRPTTTTTPSSTGARACSPSARRRPRSPPSPDYRRKRCTMPLRSVARRAS